MIELIGNIVGTYGLGYVITLILVVLSESDGKYDDIHTKFMFGLWFSIIWPITFPLALVCTFVNIGKQIYKLFVKFRK